MNLDMRWYLVLSAAVALVVGAYLMLGDIQLFSPSAAASPNLLFYLFLAVCYVLIVALLFRAGTSNRPLASPANAVAMLLLFAGIAVILFFLVRHFLR
ncbi:MAG: hypothetical protein B1H03_06750, partial [Planctomycetales bacterium 4484_113]